MKYHPPSLTRNRASKHYVKARVQSTPAACLGCYRILKTLNSRQWQVATYVVWRDTVAGWFNPSQLR